MSADFRKINLAMQSDPDFRLLPPPAQHLYYVLWCHPELSYCGVVDWRPGRLGALAHGWGRDAVEEAAACLESRHFIVTDAETEECLIRSWVRFDGLLKQPRMAVSFANAFHATASNTIRGVIVHEATKLKEREPDLSGWGKDQVREVLTFPSVDPKVRATPKDPFGDGFGDGFTPSLAQIDPKVSLSVSVPPTTATATATKQTAERGASRRKASRPLPSDWKPSTAHLAFADEHGIDLQAQSHKFRGNATAKDLRYANWDQAFRNWLDKAIEFGQVRQIHSPERKPVNYALMPKCPTCNAPQEITHYDQCDNQEWEPTA